MTIPQYSTHFLVFLAILGSCHRGSYRSACGHPRQRGRDGRHLGTHHSSFFGIPFAQPPYVDPTRSLFLSKQDGKPALPASVAKCQLYGNGVRSAIKLSFLSVTM